MAKYHSEHFGKNFKKQKLGSTINFMGGWSPFGPQILICKD